MKVRNMPKLESPFEREKINGKYMCVPKLKKEYEWIFTDDCIAVDKLDGTNVSIIVENGTIVAIFNRMNEIKIWSKGSSRFIEGIYGAIDRKYIKLSKMKDGQYFGELVGPSIQGNPYNLEKHLWIPFSTLIDKYRFKFWDSVIDEVGNTHHTEEQLFKLMSDVFKELWSIFKRKQWRSKLKSTVDENVGFAELASEGIIFYKKSKLESNEEEDYRDCCKLRRDMFDWFKGSQHH